MDVGINSLAYNSLWQVRSDAWCSLDTPEVHGFRADLGYRVHTGKALEIAAEARRSRPQAVARE